VKSWCEVNGIITQALFERAVAAKGTAQCALLWRAYIGYEAGRGRAEAARRVFLRAIHACPWSKVGNPSGSQQPAAALQMNLGKVLLRAPSYAVACGLQ
jgi:hypothetical protein